MFGKPGAGVIVVKVFEAPFGGGGGEKGRKPARRMDQRAIVIFPFRTNY